LGKGSNSGDKEGGTPKDLSMFKLYSAALDISVPVKKKMVGYKQNGRHRVILLGSYRDKIKLAQW
jgi:hypothetical protein